MSEKLEQIGLRPTWHTEPLFQQKISNPIGMVEIPDNVNEYATYTASPASTRHPLPARL